MFLDNQSIPDRLFDATMDKLCHAWLSPLFQEHLSDNLEWDLFGDFETTLKGKLSEDVSEYLYPKN